MFTQLVGYAITCASSILKLPQVNILSLKIQI